MDPIEKRLGVLDSSPADYLTKIFVDSGYQAYMVGGCVRDAILRKQPHDFDICTNAKPEFIKDILNDYGIKSIDTGIRFGTVIALHMGNQYEITTFRTDGDYLDKRRPDSVEFVDSLKEDLSRRDFTMNAIAYQPQYGLLYDPFDGRNDIERRTISCVGNPVDRFNEDPLRILRALRFAIVYGFSIDESIEIAIHENFKLISSISKERVTSEIEKMLTSGKQIHDTFIEYSDVMSTIIPEISRCIGFNQNNKYHKHDVYEHLLYVTDACDSTDFNIKMSALLHDIGKPDSYSIDHEGKGHFYGHPKICAEISQNVLKEDFRLRSIDTDEIVKLIEYHDLQPVNTTKSVRKLLVLLGYDLAKKWFILKRADISDHTGVAPFYKDLPLVEEKLERIHEEESCFKITDLEISGYDIMRVTGLPTGKEVGRILHSLFDMIISEELENSHDRLIEETLRQSRMMS